MLASEFEESRKHANEERGTRCLATWTGVAFIFAAFITGFFYYAPLRARANSTHQAVCQVIALTPLPATWCEKDTDCYRDTDGDTHCTRVVYRCTYFDVTWAVEINSVMYTMKQKAHPPDELVLWGHYTCYYNEHDPSAMRFDNRSDLTYSLFLTIQWALFAALMFGMRSFSCTPKKKRKVEATLGLYSFLLGQHTRVGQDSSVYHHFRNDPLYAPQLTNMILSFVDPRVTVKHADDQTAYPLLPPIAAPLEAKSCEHTQIVGPTMFQSM